MKHDNKIADDGERMIPDYHKGNLFYAEHMTRYKVSEVYVKDKVVLDIASGSGYGTKMISRTAKKVYGVDISEDAVAYAKEKYPAKNIEYILGDGENIPLADRSVDVVTTFETIEHISNYKKFLDEVKRVLKKDGVAIISTPNDLEYSEGNHFHIHEFQYDELNDLLQDRFKFVEPYIQSTWRAVLTGPIDTHNNDQVQKMSLINYDPLKRGKELYFYMVCSDGKITKKIEPIVGLGRHLSEASDAKRDEENAKYIEYLEKNNTSKSEEIKAQKDELKMLERELELIKNSKTWKIRNSIVDNLPKSKNE